MLCQICRKNTAVLFVNKLENGQNKQIAMCLSCAQKQGFSLKNMLDQSGLKPEDMENIGEQMNALMENMGEGGLEGLEQMFPPEMLNMMMGAAHPGEEGEDGEMGIMPEDGDSDDRRPAAIKRLKLKRKIIT